MAMTFATPVTRGSLGEVADLTMTTNASSAAGSFTLQFVPSWIVIQDQTTPIRYEWVSNTAAGAGTKIAANGTQTTLSTNGITVTTSGNTTTVTLGTDLHTNSCTYLIRCMR